MSTLVPYPAFVNRPPILPFNNNNDDDDNNDKAAKNKHHHHHHVDDVALTAVGTCRIDMPSMLSSQNNHYDYHGHGHDDIQEEYHDILEKCTLQSQYASDVSAAAAAAAKEAVAEAKKKTKMYMKQAVASCKRLLRKTLQLDVSLVEVEMVLPPSHILQTQGCLASCFLDAGCHAIVIAISVQVGKGGNSNSISIDEWKQALEVARLPRDRLMVHLDLDLDLDTLAEAEAEAENDTTTSTASTTTAHVASLAAEVAPLVSTVSVPVSLRNLLKKQKQKQQKQEQEQDDTSVVVQQLLELMTLPKHNSTKQQPQQQEPQCRMVLVLDVEKDDNDNNNNTDNDNNMDKWDAQVAQIIGQLSSSKGINASRCGVALVNPSSQRLGWSYAACLQTDRPDGLYTTVVCTRSGEALGLVYSSKDSIVAALACGRGVYYSRSRHGLWRKGDTSGHYQILHSITPDCDGDALLFRVTQRDGHAEHVGFIGPGSPAFCHLNTLTCWGPPRGLRGLEETLQRRMAEAEAEEAPAGSYTKRLLEDPELLRHKLVEEAQELAEAHTKQHVAEEMADVIYFAMVRAAKVGVTMDDVAAELDRRARKVTRRQGDSKAFRIAAGEAILNMNNQKNKNKNKNNQKQQDQDQEQEKQQEKQEEAAN